MTLTRLFIAGLGISMALLFQAWALPFFVIIVVAIGLYAVPKVLRQKSHFNDNHLDGIQMGPLARSYFVFLGLCYVLAFIMRGLPEPTQSALAFLDRLSLYQIQLPEGISYGQRTFAPNSTKILMNLTALIMPVIIAKHFPSIIRNTLPQRSLGWVIYIIGLVIFILMSFIPLIMFEQVDHSNRYFLQFIFFIYFFHVIYVSLFLKFKP